MNQVAILYPVVALAALTLFVLTLIPYQRFKAAFQKQVTADDFRLGESGNVPPAVSIPNRNYMNLLEMPVLFYVVCLALYVTASVTVPAISLAWVYVALRGLHSLVHLTYNKVLHRLTIFALSNFFLVLLWMAWLLQLKK